MATKHDHVEPKVCEHTLAFCRKCKVPYCTACGQEWAEPCNEQHMSIWPLYRQWDKLGTPVPIPAPYTAPYNPGLPTTWITCHAEHTAPVNS